MACKTSLVLHHNVNVLLHKLFETKTFKQISFHSVSSIWFKSAISSPSLWGFGKYAVHLKENPYVEV